MKGQVLKNIWLFLLINSFSSMFFGYISISGIFNFITQNIYGEYFKNGLVYIESEGIGTDGSYGTTSLYSGFFFNETYEEALKDGINGYGYQDIMRFQAPAIPIWYRQKENGAYEILRKWDGALVFRPPNKIGTVTWLFFIIWLTGILYNIYLIKQYFKFKK